jgi:ribosomal protein S18 acetylase RimI-like enzyme
VHRGWWSSWQDCRVIGTRPVEVADATHGGPAEILLDAVLGGRRQVRLGQVVDVLDLPGFAAVDMSGSNRLVGVATWSAERAEFACLGVAADVRRTGVGATLVEAVLGAARREGLERLWLTTTNDNLDALALYQRCGFRLARVVVGGVDQARELKPSIPLIGAHGIPVHDELVLECALL